ncbi:MAG: hypothetical protein JWN51_3008, partial [Phycisphaerales bacterium]|nr:hypothetical protein [Phycisphaerales bacterium]
AGPATAVDDDALYHLHKMSGTGSAFGAAEYVAINPVAIVALILGATSVLTLVLRTATPLLILPLGGIVCAILAIIQVRRSNGTQAGTGFALIGLLLSVLLGGAVVGVQALAYFATRVDNAKCAALVDRFGEMVHARHYDDAYDLVMSDNFRHRINRQKFAAQMDERQAMPGYGPIQSMQWNGEPMHFDPAGDSNNKVGYAVVRTKFKKVDEPVRETLEFTDREGDWKIDNLTDVFVKKRPKKGAMPTE